MTSDELRALQAPLKSRYRDDPATAKVTLSARGRVGRDAPTCQLESPRSQSVAGLHPAAGGDGSLLCSGDMLLEALVACAGVTLGAVATALAIPLRDATVTADGDLDFRGTLGLAKDAPVGFVEIRLQFTLDTDALDEQMAKLVSLTERYCVVYQTLRAAVPVATTFGRPPDGTSGRAVDR
jgi:uncharacterized OsmC-like protein